MQTSVMQTKEWAEFKSNHGWHYHHLLNLYVLARPLQFRLNFRYIPEITAPDHTALATLAARVQAALAQTKDSHTIFGRAEFLIPYSDSAHAVLLQAGFVKARDEVQPEYRQVIDLQKSLSTVRAEMRSKGRYNIGLAEKKGVVVIDDQSNDAVKQFIHLSRVTAARKGFQGRSEQYLRDLIGLLDSNALGGLWVARFGDEMLAGAIVSFFGTRASYLYGVSSDKNRSVMAPHLLHWRIIEEAKRKGCTEYDLIGVAPTDASSTHPWGGISRFKREFGGETVRYLGSYDRVYRPALYSLYAIARGKKRL